MQRKNSLPAKPTFPAEKYRPYFSCGKYMAFLKNKNWLINPPFYQVLSWLFICIYGL